MSPQCPYPLSKDPYEAIRQAYLVETDTASEPFEDPVETETPESPHTVASPTSLPDNTPPTRHAEESEDFDTSGARSMPSNFTTPLSPDHPLTHTSPTLVLFLCRTTRMAVRVPPVMSPGLSASIAEVATMSDSTFRKRHSHLYLYILAIILYRLQRSIQFKRTINAEDKGPTAKDEDPAAGDEGPGMGVEILSLGGDEVVPEGQPRAAPVVETAMGEPLGLGYRALRRQEIALGEGRMPSVFEIDLEDGIAYIDVLAYPPPVQTLPSPEWSSASPAMVETEGFMTELGARVEMQEGLIRDHTVRFRELSPALFEMYDRDIGELFTRPGAVIDEIFSQRYRFRSLEYEQ
ncbi:hypothetical protein Tco_1059357 [Tanacetum coccineum]